MVKYNFKEVTSNGKTFVFVTRGRSKEFTDKEIRDYLKLPDKTKDFNVANTKLFLSDLKLGMEFCTKKYGVDENSIILKAQKFFPNHSLSQLMG